MKTLKTSMRCINTNCGYVIRGSPCIYDSRSDEIYSVADNPHGEFTVCGSAIFPKPLTESHEVLPMRPIRNAIEDLEV